MSEEPPSESCNPTDTSTADDVNVFSQREESDIWDSENYGCWAYCMDLSYIATEPTRILELRTIETHKRLLASAPDNPDHHQRKLLHSIVHPKLNYEPRLPRTGSIVMSNWCALGSVATAATAETSLSPTHASVSLVLLDECADDDDEEGDDDDDGAGVEIEDILSHQCSSTGEKPEGSTINVSPCVWGYFVDSVTPPPPSPSQPNPTNPGEASSSQEQKRSSFAPYRRFMSKEIAASARYEDFAPVVSADEGRRRVTALQRVPATSNLRFLPTEPR